MNFSLTRLMREFSHPTEKAIKTRAAGADDQPARYDIERVNEALEGPGVVVPEGLSASEILAFFDEISVKEE